MAFAIMFAYMGVGLIFMLISIPLMRGKIGPNRWYGFRTPKTLSSPEIWHPANIYSGRMFFIAGIVIMIGSPVIQIIGGALRLRAETTDLLLVGWMSVTVIWALWQSFVYLKKL